MNPSTALPTALVVLTAAAALTPVLCRLLGRHAGFALALGYLAAAATLLPAAREVLAGGHPAWSRPWVPGLDIDISLRADGLGIVFATIALVIGAVVLTYATRYLDSTDADGHPKRHTGFYTVMASFTLAMTGLVLADDLVLLFTCWEITSIASFMLVGQGGRGGELASMRTMFLTFLGGLALLVAVGMMVARVGTTSVSQVLADPVWTADPRFTTSVAVLVLIAGFTKSAQFPFHVWLPDAMAASTPVSAYLHAAAVVKAGIFLLLRFSPAFHATPAWNVTLLVIGLFTCALGALFALQQTDLKKLMAYSTVSQLGLVVATIGVGTAVALAAAVVHVVAHALFKSGLFMMVGVVDHAAGTRDLRRLPSLWRQMPLSFAVTLVGAASMAGVPPLLGFVSKEGLFTGLSDAPGGSAAGWAALIAGAAGSVLTFAYCVKIVFGVFIDGPREEHQSTAANESHASHGSHALHAPGPLFLGAAASPILAGIPLGLMPGVLDHVVDVATHAALPHAEHHTHLALWHGVTPELLATLVVFACGIAVIFARHRLWPMLERPFLPGDGADVIAGLRHGLRRFGLVVSHTVAGHHPSRHLTPIVGAFAAVVLLGALTLPALPPAIPNSWRALDGVLFVLITASVVLLMRTKARLGAVVGLSAVGILVTVQLLSLGAPDVALTQLLVEALTIVVIMLVLQKLPLTFGPLPTRARVSKGAVALAAGLAAGVATWMFSGRRERSALADYYLTHTEEISSGHNIVNVILVEFRALDTLGELAVLGMTGVALVAVLAGVRDRALDPHPIAGATDIGAPAPMDTTPYDTRHAPRPALNLRAAGSTAHRAITEAWPNTIGLQLMVRIMVPLLVVVSAMLFWRGHNAPGGGFIAALVGSAIIGLVYLSTSRDRQIGPPRLPVTLIGGGVIVAVGTGLLDLVLAGSFLEPIHGEIAHVHLTTSMLFDAGVYMAVLGLIMAAFNLLGTGESTDTERTHERAEEMTEGEIAGDSDAPAELDGESRARARTTFISSGRRPSEVGREAAPSVVGAPPPRSGDPDSPPDPTGRTTPERRTP